jgi:thioredoxin 1
MSDSEELADIKARKREELERKLRGEETGEEAEVGAAPTTPVPVEGESHLSEFVSTHDVVLVDFHAEWCGPCKMLEPTVDALARDSPAAVAKVDIDVHQDLAAQYGVQGVPTLLLFSDDELVERVVGVRDQGSLESLVDQYS